MNAQTVFRKFTSDGNAYNLVLGFIPAHAEVINRNAADTEVWKLEYNNMFGDSQEIWHYMHDNDGGDDVATPVIKASGGYVAEYDSNVIQSQLGCTFDYTGGAAEDLITCTVATNEPTDGDKIKFVESGGLATGLGELLNYYAIDCGVYGAGTFRVSLTKGGSAVAMTSDGTAPNYFLNLSQSAPNISGGKGITISASFMADGDVIYVKAIQSDNDTNLGDITP
jgi:hypothetical protein